MCTCTPDCLDYNNVFTLSQCKYQCVVVSSQSTESVTIGSTTSVTMVITDAPQDVTNVDLIETMREKQDATYTETCPPTGKHK